MTVNYCSIQQYWEKTIKKILRWDNIIMPKYYLDEGEYSKHGVYLDTDKVNNTCDQIK